MINAILIEDSTGKENQAREREREREREELEKTIINDGEFEELIKWCVERERERERGKQLQNGRKQGFTLPGPNHECFKMIQIPS